MSDNHQGHGPHAPLPETSDPVVIYDVLVEAGTRLLGRYAARARDDEDVASFGRAVEDRIAALDIEDLDGQRALTAQLKAEYRALQAR